MLDIRPLDWIDLGSAALQLGVPIVVLCLALLTTGLTTRDTGFITAARRGFYVVTAAMTVSIGALAAAFLTRACFDVAFVHGHSDTTQPWYFQLAGVWSGQEGSLLFWAWILSLYGAALAFWLRKRTDRAAVWTLIVFGIVQLYFIAIVVLLEQNPFQLHEHQVLVSAVLNSGGGEQVVMARQALEWLSATPVAGSAGLVDTAFLHAGDLVPGVLAGQLPGVPVPQGVTYAQVVGPEVMDRLHALAANPLPADLAPQRLASMVVDGAHAAGWSVLPNGAGLNPLLANYWIAIHPPCMYTGLIGCAAIFAIALGGLIGGRIDGWARDVRRWLLFTWLFLSVGNILGGLWAYEELGWGGFWDWDPVENAAFVPWLTATALLHTIIAQDRRRVFRAMNVILAAVTFALTIWGTWVTRSGAIDSIHAFAEGPMIGYALFSAVGVVLAVTTLLVVHRWPVLSARDARTMPDAPPLKARGRVEALASREAAYLGGAVLLVILMVAIVALTMWPLLTWRIDGESVATRESYYIAAPLFVLMFMMMGAAMSLPWRRTRKELLGPRLVRPALVGLAVAVVFGIWQFASTDLTLAPFFDGMKIGADASVLARDFIMPFVPPFVFGTAAFALITLLLEFHIPARTAARGAASRLPADDASTGNAATEAGPPVLPATAAEGRSLAMAYLRAIVRLIRRNRRRYGGYIAHVGALMLLVGICVATQFKREMRLNAVPLGGAMSFRAGFPGDRTFTYTLRRVEVGARLAMDHHELAPRLVQPGESSSTLPAGTRPMLVREPDDITAAIATPQIDPDGEMPVALFEATGTHGLVGQHPHPVLDYEIALRFGLQPDSRAARTYLPGNHEEITRMLQTGEMDRLLTYTYARMWLELRIDAPTVTLDLSPLIGPDRPATMPDGRLRMESGGDVREVSLRGRQSRETPARAFERMKSAITARAWQLGVSVMAIGDYRLALTPTGAAVSLSGERDSAQQLRVTADGPEVIGEPEAEVVEPTALLQPTVRRYYMRQAPRPEDRFMITREAHILRRIGADEFVVPLDILRPPANNPGGVAVAAFAVHHNPAMTWNLLGAIVLVIGTVVAGWPDRRRKPDAGDAAEAGGEA